MIHLPENGNVQVADIAWNEIGHDVALTVRRKLIAAREPVQYEVDVFWPLTFRD
jgi:hypothetical protein